MSTSNNKNLRIISPELIWAKKKLDEVIFGCVLNIKLHQSGICPMLIIEMDEQDLKDYTKFLDHIFTQ